MTTPKGNFIDRLMGVKAKTQTALQNYGGNIRSNMNKADSNFSSGKSNYYASSNPFPNPLKSSSYERPR